VLSVHGGGSAECYDIFCLAYGQDTADMFELYGERRPPHIYMKRINVFLQIERNIGLYHYASRAGDWVSMGSLCVTESSSIECTTRYKEAHELWYKYNQGWKRASLGCMELKD